MIQRVFLIRHARTSGNALGRYIGCRTDEDLSPEGAGRARDMAQSVRKITGDDAVIFSGPLKRCVNTAKLLFPSADIHIIDELREIDFGVFEGKTYDELASDAVYRKWVETRGVCAPPEGESIADMTKRSIEGVLLAIKAAGDAKDIVIVCHGGNIMAVLNAITGGDLYDHNVANLEGYVLEGSFDGIGENIERLSDLSYSRLDGGHTDRSSDR